MPLLREEDDQDLKVFGIRSSLTSSKYTLLERQDNIGMDMASHNISIAYMTYKRRIDAYK
jgi:hypothetical protein